MKKLLFGLALLTLTFSGFSQEKNKKTPNEKEKYFSKDATFETDDYKVYITNAVAMGPYSKFKMRVVNKTNDYLVFKTSEIGFITDDKKASNTEKDLMIAPNDDDFRVVDFKGTQMQADKFIIDLKGVYKASSKVKALSATDLPN